MKKFHPLISIVIPVYNGSNYMKEAIDSALNQTYDNIEVIVVNDGSSDNGKTDEIAKSYGNKIRYFVKENGRVASALNYGIDRMKGKYFSWLSHDDIYLPNKIEDQVNQLSNIEDKDTILYSAYELIDSNSKKIGNVEPHLLLSEEQLNTSLIPLFRGLIHGCSMLISKKWFNQIGKFDEKLRSTQDYDLWFNFLNRANIHYCHKPLIQSRLHQEQDSKTIPNINDEANQLWIGFLNKISEDKMKASEGSAYAFYRRAELFLKTTPYEGAAKYAAKKAQKYINTPKVSVIIPVYNRISMAIEAIHSALKQTHKNIEIIIVNDGSTDDTKPLTEIAKKHKNIKYFTQKNKGVSAARNLGITKATGEYIAFLDSDDLFKPKKIELQLKKMIDDDCYISHTSYNRVSKSGEFIQKISSGKLKGNVFSKIIVQCPIATPTVLVRKNLLEKHKFSESISIGEDTCLWIDLIYGRKLSSVEDFLADVRFYDETTVNNQEKYLKGHLNIIHHIINTQNYCDYKDGIANLLIATASTIDPSLKPSLYNMGYKFILRLIKIPVKLYHSFRIFGFRETMKIIYNKLKIHNNV